MKGLLNWRVFSFFMIATLPMWLGIISITVVMIEEKIDEILQRRQETE